MSHHSKSELRRALWSVRYHSLFLPHPGDSMLSRLNLDDDALNRLIPIPISAAIDILLQDYDEHDNARRLRALYLLSGAGLANQDYLDTLRKSLPGLSSEIEETAERVGRLVKHFGLDVAILARVPPESASRILDELLSRSLLTTDPCLPQGGHCETCFDGQHRRIKATATARINRQAGHMAKALDPRSWDDCSDVFDQTFTVAPGRPSGSTHAPHGNYHLVDVPKEIGESWKGWIYEVVFAGLDTFQNVLRIDFTKSANEVCVDYILSAGLQPSPGALTKNRGYVKAVNILGQPGWSDLTVYKEVWFSTYTGGGMGEVSNWLAPVILCMWLNDATDLGPCCQVPSPS